MCKYWMQTYSGIKFCYDDPKPEMILIADIAHALSMKCRYNGHLNEFYSVADHSVQVSELVPKPIAMHGLLHDAAEVYMADVPRPLRKFLNNEYDKLEQEVLGVIYEAFDLKELTEEEQSIIQRADDLCLASEADTFFDEIIDGWAFQFMGQDELITGYTESVPKAAKERFYCRYQELV